MLDLRRQPGFLRRIIDKSESEATRIVDAALVEEGWLVKSNVGAMIGAQGWPDRTYYAPTRYPLNCQWGTVTINAEWKGQNVNACRPLQQKILRELALRQHIAVAIYVDASHRLQIRAAGEPRAAPGFTIDLMQLTTIGDVLIKACFAACDKWWRQMQSTEDETRYVRGPETL